MPSVTIHLREVDTDAKLGGDLSVSGATNLEGNSIVDGTLSVGGNASFAGEIQTSNLNVNGNIGVATTSPGEKLHVNGNLRLGSSSNNTVDDNSNRYISTAGQLQIKSNDSGLNDSFVNLILQSGKTDPGKIVIGGGNSEQFRDIEFFTAGSSTERMRIHHNGYVGVGTSSPGRRLEVYTGDGSVPGLRLRRYPTGSTYTDFQHADSTSPANSKEGLAIITSDGNATTQEVMRICGDGNVGVGTTNPAYKLHVNGDMKFVGNIWKNWGTGRFIMDFDKNYRQGLHFSTADRTLTMFSTGASGDGGTITFNTRNATGSDDNDIGVERMRIDSGGNVGINTTIPYTKLHVLNTDDNTGTGDGFISGLTANTDNRKPSECLRLQGQWRSPGSGGLLRFTNTHGGGTNPNTGEYYYIGNDKTKKYVCEHDIYYKLCNVCEQYTRKYNTKDTLQRLTDENGNRYYIGKDNTKKYVCEHDINKIYCPKCKYLCIHLTKKSKCNICKNSGS